MKALITGITGQDGSYLAESLLDKGYEVYGLERRLSVPNDRNIEHIKDRIRLLSGDMSDQNSLMSAVSEAQPDEVYNLAAQSFVPASHYQAELTGDVNGLGVVRILSAIRAVKQDARFYQASTSEMFGNVQETPQTETTRFHPRSPYGCSKVFAYWTTVNHRESYDIHASNGILFNHESPRRGSEFITRKVTRAIARIQAGSQSELKIGNLDSRRDWGFAGDYVEAMQLMLQQDTPDDYVIATGQDHTVREFIETAFGVVGINLTWEGEREKEVGYDSLENPIVSVDPQFFRPAEVHILKGDPTKAKTQLGWEPTTTFEELVEMMVEADIEALK
ncbi:MAG: GDP-mannose 4,6-dehydratase [Nanoarchaeota archaeon]|nr:GDP-mannose 4,6-dehydratase [Nanoarchaeota archaeon]|tara:strand:- start:437 stop:1438 length:1002 start_codon:yes stop_codon:yes gene_type:complete